MVNHPIGTVVRRSDGFFESQKLSVITEIEDGVAVTRRVGRPSFCPDCGRDPDRMEITDTDYQPADNETIRLGSLATGARSYPTDSNRF